MTNEERLSDYLKTLDYVTINQETDGVCSVTFDASNKAKALYSHLTEYLKGNNTATITKDPVNNLKRIVVSKSNLQCQKLIAYIRSLVAIEEIEYAGNNEYAVFKANIEQPIVATLIGFLKTNESFVEINLSSPGDIIQELRKGYEILFGDFDCW